MNEELNLKVQDLTDNEEWAVTDQNKQELSVKDKEVPSISLKNAYPNDKDMNSKVPYSRTQDIYYMENPDSEIKQIHFTKEQREIMNTIDRCHKQGKNVLILDAFICNHYMVDADYEVKPEEREHFFSVLSELALLTGMRVQTDGEVYQINIGSLVPVRIQIEGYVNGVFSKNLIKIDDYTCIHGDSNSHNIEYWRLKFPNKYTRKTLKNIIISRTVLDSWLTGESVDIESLCDELEIESAKGRHDLIKSINQCISYQNGSVLPETKHLTADDGGRGRPAITEIETRRQS